MIKKAIGVVRGMEAIKQAGLLVVVVALIIAVWSGYSYFHDKGVAKKAIKEIVVIEKGVRDGDLKRVEKARENIASKSDCDKLSIVYNTDRCTGQQGASEKDFQKTRATKKENLEGVGLFDAKANRGSVFMGGILQDKKEKQGVSEEERLVDKIKDIPCTSINMVIVPNGCEVFCNRDPCSGEDYGLSAYCAGEHSDAR